MKCGCPDVRVQVILPGGGPWNFKKTADAYVVELQGVGELAEDSAAVNSLRYLRLHARPFEGCDGCASWLLVDVRALPDATDLVDEAVWLWGTGPIGASGLGWASGGPLGVIGFDAVGSIEISSLSLEAVPAEGTELTIVITEDTGGVSPTEIPTTGTIGADAVDTLTSLPHQVITTDADPIVTVLPSYTLTGTGTATADFPVVLALPNPAPVAVPLPITGWSFALRLPSDSGLGAVVGRGVILTLSGRYCAHQEAA